MTFEELKSIAANNEKYALDILKGYGIIYAYKKRAGYESPNYYSMLFYNVNNKTLYSCNSSFKLLLDHYIEYEKYDSIESYIGLMKKTTNYMIIRYNNSNKKIDLPEINAIEGTFYNGIGKIVIELHIKFYDKVTNPFANDTFRGYGSNMNSKPCNIERISLYNIEKIPAYAFNECHKLMLFSTDATLIATNALSHCYNLEHVSIDSAKRINGYAFSGCSSLKSLNAASLTHIEICAFMNCQSLISLGAPNLSYIGDEAFKYCLSLSNIGSKNINIVEKYAFTNCKKLERIDLTKCLSIGLLAFNGCDTMRTIYAPECITFDMCYTGNAHNYANMKYYLPKCKILYYCVDTKFTNENIESLNDSCKIFYI